MSNPSLPAPLQQKLASLAVHVRRLRFRRGISLVVMAAALVFGLAFLADLAFDLTEETFSWILAGGVKLVGLTALFGLILPLRRRLDFEALAALIEQKHPELAERLTTSVELTQGKGKFGSQELIAFLLQDTEERTRNLVFRHAFPSRPIRRLTGLAVLALALLALPAFVMPAHYGEFTGRFLLCWFAPPALQFEVTPGDGYAARGKPQSWVVTMHRRDERIAWPQSANLIIKDEAGRKKQIMMQAKDTNTFTCGIDQVPDTFSYYIDAGSARSPLFKIQAVEPVELASKPVVTITPPAYVNREVYAVKKFEATSHFAALQYGLVRFDFHFTRPAVAVTIKLIQPDQTKGENHTPKTWTLPVQTLEGSSDAFILMPMLAAGTYKLSIRMEAEQHIATEQDLPDITVRADQTPGFTILPSFYGLDVKEGATSKTSLAPSVAGQPVFDYGQASAIAPGDALHLKVGAADEEGLDQLDVEYRINNGPVLSETLGQASGNLKLHVEHQLKLQGKVKDGDTVQFRIKASDNRSLKAGQFKDASGMAVPANDLTPQAVYYPPALEGKEQWLALKIDPKAGPIQEREIVAQHESVQKQIEAIKKKIEQERTDLKQFDQFSKNHGQWSNQEIQKLTKLRNDNKDSKNDLVDLAMKTLKIPELNPVSFQSFQIAKNEMTQSDDAMMQAQQQKGNAATRDKEMARADQELAQAIKKLDALNKLNEQLAKERIEQSQLKELANKEDDLSKKVAELEAKKALGDPKDQAELAKAKADQDKLAKQIQELAQKNQMLQSAMKKAKAIEAQKLSKEAMDLAQAQNQVAKELKKAMAQHEKDVIEEFAKKQQVIADKSLALAEETDTQAKGRQLPPLNPKPAQNAATSLKQAAVVQALGEQEQSWKELQRLADGLDGVLIIAGDPGGVLQQLIKKQKELEDRLVDESRQVATKKDAELFKAFQQIVHGQNAIHVAAQKLVGQQPAFAQFEDHASKAIRALQFFDTVHAFDYMQQTRQSLETLANGPALKPIDPPKGKPEPKSDDVAEQIVKLRKLAKEQWDLREQLQKYLTDPDGSSPDNKNLTELAKKQKELEQKGKNLTDAMMKLSQAHGDSPEAKQSSKEAAMSSEEAHKSMKKAQDQGEKGNGLSAKEAAEEAAKMLAQAAKQADETAKALGLSQPKSKDDEDQMNAQKEMAKALAEGQKEADNAKGQLEDGKLGDASKSMKQAAQALKQSAQQMAAQMKSGQGGMNPARISFAGPQSFGAPELEKYGDEGKKNAGKTWGELPGKLKTRILSDMRAQYGEEYAAIIQRYFEQQAELDQGKK